MQSKTKAKAHTHTHTYSNTNELSRACLALSIKAFALSKLAARCKRANKKSFSCDYCSTFLLSLAVVVVVVVAATVCISFCLPALLAALRSLLCVCFVKLDLAS